MNTKNLTIAGRGAIGGVAGGQALISRKTIIGWGGIDIFKRKVKRYENFRN